MIFNRLSSDVRGSDERSIIETSVISHARATLACTVILSSLSLSSSFIPLLFSLGNQKKGGRKQRKHTQSNMQA